MDSKKTFITYKSSAGSGKTYTLVKEFLKLVFQSHDPKRYRNILAITFTNKAANEMKERVIENLKTLSESQDNLLQKDYADDFGLTRAEIKHKASQVLQSVLHNYSDLKISTIDKFTHKIIRAFAKDLNLTGDFEVEMDKDKVLIQAIDLMISRAGEDDRLSGILLEYLNTQIDNEKDWKIEKAIFEFSKELTNEESQGFLERINEITDEDFQEIKTHLSQLYTETKKRIEVLGNEIIDLFIANGLTKADFSRGTIFNFFDSVKKGEFDKLLAPPSTLTLAITDDKWLPKKASEAAKSSMATISDEIRSLYFTITRLSKDYFLYLLLNDNIFNLILLKEINQSIEFVKEEENILMISDFNRLISNEIKNQPAPFIYEKIGERYKNIMIDEFQDTSVLQWHNLLPLIDNSLSVGEKTLLVGDAKQAIYRFRGGKVEQFVELPSIIDKGDDFLLEEREVALHYNHENKVLDTNYRSHDQVIEFNNWFFDRLTSYLEADKQKIYERQKQHSTDKNQGYVNVSFLPYDKDEITDLYLNKTLEKIEECIADGFQLKDIAILVDKNKYGLLISNFLVNKGYKVLTSESLLIKEDKEVNFVINFLRFIQNNKDNNAKLALMKYFFTNEEYSSSLLFYSNMTNHKANIEIGEVLLQINPHFDLIALFELSLYDMAETIIRQFIPLQQTTNSFLIKLLDVIHGFASRKNDLMEFLGFWDKKSDKISLETPEDNAITIMTVHKSKGLQFPVVISSFTNWKFYSSFVSNKWVELTHKIPNLPVGILPLNKNITGTEYAYLKEIEDKNIKLDKFNLLYVALTRPEKRLYVISDDNVMSKNVYKDNLISSFLYQICLNHDQFNEGELVIGNRIPQLVKEEQGENVLELSSITSTNWREKIRISQQYQELWGEKGYKEKIAYGNLIHNILSQIEKSEDIQVVISDYLDQGLIKNEEKELFENEIKEIISSPQVYNWFNNLGLVMNEREILSKEGKLYRPDKVISCPDKTILVDFKTGDKHSSHASQIKNYANLLAEMGYQNIEKYLLYTRDREVETIT